MIKTRREASRIFLIDRFTVEREALTARLHLEPGMSVCGAAENARTAVALVGELRPHVVITEVALEGGSALEFIARLQNDRPEVRVLVLSMYDEILWAERALGAGAAGYVMKSEPTRRVIEAVRRVSQGATWVSEAINLTLLKRMKRTKAYGLGNPVSLLTDREGEVFRMLGQGLAVRHVATRLGISVKTVEVHRENLKEKLGLGSARDLRRYAMTHQLNGDK